MKSGIYLIRNKVNGKVYIGQSVEVERRLGAHKNNLNKNKHPNSYLQNSFNKEGLENFDFKVIEMCEEEKLDIKETEWIKKFDSMNRDKGFNRESGGNFGRVYSPERKKDLTGNGNPMFGKSHSAETKETIKFKNRGSSENLTVKDISEIKKELCTGETQTVLAKKYKVTKSTINKIAKCKNWEWVEEELNNTLINLSTKTKEKRNKDIIELKNQGKTIDEISQQLKCGKYTIYQTLKKITEQEKKDNERIKNEVLKDFEKGIDRKEILKKHSISKTTYVRITSKSFNKKKQNLIKKVHKLKEQGLLNKEIAQTLKIHRTTVTEYLKKNL